MRFWTALLAFLLAGAAYAGTIYEVTATGGTEKMTYRVKFGGGKAASQWTAFDPKSKKFVYLTWERSDPAPEPVAAIWDHRTGETVKLYKFPNVEHPLPVIPSIKDMKVCPLTGDKEFTSKRVGNYD
jgi:hypothetical protein